MLALIFHREPDNVFRNGADSFRSRKRSRYLWTRPFWEDFAGFVGLVVFVYLLTRISV